MKVLILWLILLSRVAASLPTNPFEIQEFQSRCPSPRDQGELVIHHIAVGQGDATFIKTPGGSTILVDGGPPGTGEVLARLKNCYGIRALDYVVLTHFHNDHYGSLAKVFSQFPVRNAIYDPGDIPSREGSLGRYLASATETGKRRTPALGRGAIFTNDGVTFDVVSVNGYSHFGLADGILERAGWEDRNARSIAIKVSYGTFDYFIGGDLTGGGLGTPDMESLVAPRVGDVDVYHANHHGSSTSSNQYFLETLRPEIIVVSAGLGGTNQAAYHLPSQSVINRMMALPFVRAIYQTSAGESLSLFDTGEKIIAPRRPINRDVLVVTDGETIRINHERPILTDGN